MSYLLRKSDVVTHLGGSFASVGRAFAPILGKPMSKVAVRKWGELVPELRARQLLEHYPSLKEFVLDPETRLTAAEMRAKLREADA